MLPLVVPEDVVQSLTEAGTVTVVVTGLAAVNVLVPIMVTVEGGPEMVLVTGTPFNVLVMVEAAPCKTIVATMSSSMTVETTS